VTLCTSTRQQAEGEELEFIRKTGLNCEPPGEPEYLELLRLFDEEIASVREEFEICREGE